MKINFVVNSVFSGWEPTDTRLGGTEDSVREWAKELQKRGHEVHVYRNGRGNGLPNYHEREEYMGEGDICINVKSYDIKPSGDRMFYLTNEVDAAKYDLSMYEGVILPSQWAVDNLGIKHKNIQILPHGYDPEKIYPGKKIPKQCFYASSPDRGLNTLLEVWPRVYEAHPDATLLLTYGVEGADSPGIINLGEVDEETMNEVYRTSDIWCHPADGGELFCMTGIKAQVAGCWPVVIPVMALSETVRYGSFATKESYANTLIAALENHPKPPRLDYPTWQDSATMLLNMIGNKDG